MKARTIRIDGDIAYIPLTRGHEAIIDAIDLYLVKDWNWSSVVTKHAVYARRNAGTTKNRIVIYLHRLIMSCPDGFEVDHKDGNGLNNRRSNLRIATTQQNRSNQRKRIDNNSGYKGVGWHKKSNKWRARININGVQKHLGLFDDIEDAKTVYATSSKEMHGEFGRLG